MNFELSTYNDYIDYIRYAATLGAGIGATVVAQNAYHDIKHWLKQRKENRFFSRQQMEEYQRQWDEYTAALKTKITNLEDDLRESIGTNLTLVDERNILSNRNKLLAREIACDPDKKTQVLR